MKNERDCKIVQDLLPNYLENLTNEETKVFVEEHLKECEECQKQLENMKKDIELNQVKSNKRDVKYIKKFGRKMRILKLIVLVIVLIFVGRTTRNAIIISRLSKKAEQVIQLSNYHKTVYAYSCGSYQKMEMFEKDNKMKIDSIQIDDIQTHRFTMYGVQTGVGEFGLKIYNVNNYMENSIIRKRI